MPPFVFTPAWTNLGKPHDVQMPFHRIHVPASLLLPAGPGRRIDGFGYRCGCRSTKDYDGKIGEEIGKQIGKLFQVLTGIELLKFLADGITRALKVIPLIGPLIAKPIEDALDEFDPIVALFKIIGNKLDALLVDSIIRSIPAWVPVNRAQPELPAEAEVDGVVVRSYQRFDSVPFTQWHRWYDWSFRISPSPGFTWLVGGGNALRTSNDDVAEFASSGIVRFDRFLIPFAGSGGNDRSVDCEIDLGEWAQPPGPFFSPFPIVGPPRDWAWPMAGSYFWACGPLVYDCSRTTSNLRQKDLDDEKSRALGEGMHLDQIHPCKGVATARWEAFKFKENEKPVPAIQFMFVASRLGPKKGDMNFKGRALAINDRDYDFVVDLPIVEAAAKTPRAIGHSPDFAQNTLVVRPRLLLDVDFERFSRSPIRQDDRSGGLQPIVEPIFPADPAQPPKQVRVRIPLTKLSAGVALYGVVLSLGWHDPDGSLARQVRKVTIDLMNLTPFEVHESGDPEWIVNVGVNGRWFQQIFGFKGKPGGAAQKPTVGRPLFFNGASLVLFLAEDDLIHVSVHGMEEDGIGDIMNKPETSAPFDSTVPPRMSKDEADVLQKAFRNDRILRLAKEIGVGDAKVNLPFVGERVDWEEDVDQSTPVKASEVARAIFLRLGVEAGFDANDVLGFIDPDVQAPDHKRDDPATQGVNDATDTPNPLRVGDVVKEVGLGVFKTCRLTAYQVDVIGRVGTLGFDPKKVDYTLHYQVRIEEQ